ncbi:MAG: periplasmic heavy metal sensor [Pseudomonadota bacterium]
MTITPGAAATALALALALAHPWSAAAQSLEGAEVVPAELEAEEAEFDDFERLLYRPEVVIQNARRIGLAPEQRAALIDRIVDTQAAVTRLELGASVDRREIAALLEAEPIDETAALSALDTLLSVETETKRLYLKLLIAIRNTLTPEQRARLDALEIEDD